MSLTNGQKRAIHAAARQARIDPRRQEDRYRLVLRNVGGFHSAADRTATRYGFVCCMAFFEERAGGRLHGNTPGYWAEAEKAETPLDALRFKVGRLADDLGWSPTDVDSFLASDRLSRGVCRSVRTAPKAWLWRLVEALKAIKARREHEEALR